MTKLLMVEDDDFVRETLAGIVQERFPQMEIQGHGEGTGAIEKVRRFLPDIVIMDLNLPGENGFAVTEKIRAEYPDVTVIVYTSHDLPEYREAARLRGVSHFAVKGTTSLFDLLELISSCCSMHPPPAGSPVSPPNPSPRTLPRSP